jgi:hypothetical protein
VRTNFITLLDFDVLLLIIVTKALLSVLNKSLFPSNFNVQVNKARTMGTNSKRVISLIISEFKAVHVEGSKNVIADALSRFQMARFWKVAPNANREPAVIRLKILEIISNLR